MRPSEALPQDWGLYYNNTYMEHRTRGPVKVSVSHDTGELIAKPILGGGAARVAAPEDLSVWFPAKGAFNTKAGATYIARRALRQMRKSMTLGDLYYGVVGDTLSSKDMLRLLAGTDSRFTPARKAFELVHSGRCTGRAISRNLMILGGPGMRPIVMYKGVVNAGTYNSDTGRVQLNNSNYLITDIIKQELEEGGIRCIS